MYDSDDIRFSKEERRPPWELSATGQLREHFSCQKVDELGGPRRCNEVERQKQQRQKIQDQRAENLRAAQIRREEAQRRMGEPQTAGSGADQPPPPQDPRARRYDYSRVYRVGVKPRRGNHMTGVAVIIILALVLTAVFQFVAADSLYEDSESVWGPEEFWNDEDFWDDEEDSDEYWGGYDDESFGGSEDYEQYPSASEEELPRAELTGAMELEVVSDDGKQALSYQELYARCAPSTVSITVYSSEGVGTGTGIVMTEDGYILTCEHVIADSSSCTVMTWDDQLYDATLVGADAQTDLAVLKIQASGLTAAEFGDSDELTVGDEALAIGDPLGTELRGTLTNGIVSAINRNVVVNGYSMTLLQTTAALNSGNSGGPLINIYGQVVGVNNMKMNSGAVTVEGLGFAVPTSVVREIIPELTAVGKISRPVLGVTCYSLDEQAAESEGYPIAGLLVASVNQDADCYTQGIRVGDLIWAVNGVEVCDVTQVKEVIQDLDVSDTVTISCLRFEDEEDLSVYDEYEVDVKLVDQADIS